MLSLGQLCDDGCNVLLNKQKMYAIKDKQLVIEREKNYRDDLWEIIIPSHPNGKMSVQTNNCTTIVSHEIIYVSAPKYKIQYILSVTIQISSCTQQLPT